MKDKIEFEGCAKESSGPCRISHGSTDVYSTELTDGRNYRVTIERVRAQLPPYHEWSGNTILRRGHPIYKDRSYRVDSGRVYICWAGYPCHSVTVDICVVDAFREEGLL